MWGLPSRPTGTPVRCSCCRKGIAVQVDNVLVPTVRQLTALGALPMKRVGWFCSRACVGAYEFRFRVILEPEPWSSVEARLSGGKQAKCSGSGSN
jgi:hypothetical protein